MLSALVDGPPSCYLTHSPVLTAAPPANLCGRIRGYASLSAVSRLNEAGASTGIQGGILQKKKERKIKITVCKRNVSNLIKIC